MTTATARPARPGDEHDILRLIHALADYEREPDAVEITAEGLAAHLFADDPRVFAHVAEQDGRIVGIALWFLNFSTWTGRHGIYLEDLFVDPAARGAGGAAEHLFEALAAEAAGAGLRSHRLGRPRLERPGQGLLPAPGRPAQRHLGVVAPRR